MPSPLMSHQLEAAKKSIRGLNSFKGFYLAHAPGTGKTLTAIVDTRILALCRVVVVTNVAGQGVWKRELDHWWEPDLWTHVYGDSYGNFRTNPKIIITGYDQLSGDRGKERLRIINKFNPELLILDESHKIKSPSSERTKAIRKIKTDMRLLMSGTPAHNPLDWWTQFNLIAPWEEMWGGSFTAYKQKIAIQGNPHVPYQVTGFRPEVKHEAVQAFLPYTHLAPASVLDLEEPRFTVVPFDLTRRERVVYDKMERDLLVDLTRYAGPKVAINNPMQKPMRLHQITGGFLSTGDSYKLLGTSKLQILEDLVEERWDEKIIICAAFLNEINLIKSKKWGRPIRVITGATSARERTEIEDWFQKTDQHALLVIQPRAGGEAITLTASRTMIFYSLDPSVIAFQQTIARIFRKGQTRRIQVLFIAADGTVDEPMWLGLHEKLGEVSLASLLIESMRLRHARSSRDSSNSR